MRRTVVAAAVVPVVLVLVSVGSAVMAAPRAKASSVVPQTTPLGPICFTMAPFLDVLVTFLDFHGSTAAAYHYDGVGRDLSGDRPVSLSVSLNAPNPTTLSIGVTTYPKPGYLPVFSGGTISLSTYTGPGQCFAPGFDTCGDFTFAVVACPATVVAREGPVQGQAK